MADTPLIHGLERMLTMLSNGRFLDRCDDHLRIAIEKLESLPGAKGKARITITLGLAYVEGRIDIKPTVVCKLPEEKGFASTVFFTHESALSLQHPRQIEMSLGPREVGPGEAGLGRR